MVDIILYKYYNYFIEKNYFFIHILSPEGANFMKKTGLLLTVLLVTASILLCSCMHYSSFDELSITTTTYNYSDGPGNIYDSTTTYYVEPATLPGTVYEEITTSAAIPEATTPAVRLPEITTVPVLVPEATTAAPAPQTPSEPDYSSYTKSQIIEAYSKALNTTRGYQGNFTATVTESFDANIKEAHPGGQLTQLLADNIVKLVGSEGQQTLNFSGGKATNSDGESVPVLLPQRTSFSLPAEGVSSARIEKAGDKTHIVMTLVPETVSMGQVPKYNSSSVGYLDTSDMDFKIITISRVDISYTGSVIDAYIRADGYIESVTYTINMSTYAELSGMGITGYGTLEGAQTEKWVLNW